MITFGVCTHCKVMHLLQNGVVFTHDFPKFCKQVCPGSGRAPLRVTTVKPVE